jgi:hypothetical protein
MTNKKNTTTTTPATPATANITTDTFGIAIINRDNFSIVNTENARTACNFIADAIEIQDKSTGALAYWCAQLQSIWTTTTVKGYTKIVPFLENVFKLSKSQVYNYLNAGDSIIIGTTEDGKKVYTDTWHCKDGTPDFTVKPFSCTALIRIAEFIGNDGNTPALIEYVQKMVNDGAITSEMSVSQIVEVLYANSPVKKEKKKSSKSNTQNAQNAQNAQSDAQSDAQSTQSAQQSTQQNAQNAQSGAQNAQLVFDRAEIEEVKELIDYVMGMTDTTLKASFNDENCYKALQKALDILTGINKVKEAVKAVEK